MKISAKALRQEYTLHVWKTAQFGPAPVQTKFFLRILSRIFCFPNRGAIFWLLFIHSLWVIQQPHKLCIQVEWNFQSKLAEFRTSAVSNKASWTLKEHLGLVIPISLPETSRLPVYLQSKVRWSAWSYKCWGRRSHRGLHPHPAGLLKNHQLRKSWLKSWELEVNKMDRFCWMWGERTYTCFIVVFLCRRRSKPDNEIHLHSPILSAYGVGSF